MPVDTWDVLREIKERRPAIMLSELINCRTQASQPSERREPASQGSGSLETLNPGMKSWGHYEWLRQTAEALNEQRNVLVLLSHKIRDHVFL
jgi:hypothetical protein